MLNARPRRRGQAPKPRSGAPTAQGWTAAIAVAAQSTVPSIAWQVINSIGVTAPIDSPPTLRIYTCLTDVTPVTEAELPAPRLYHAAFPPDSWPTVSTTKHREAASHQAKSVIRLLRSLPTSDSLLTNRSAQCSPAVFRLTGHPHRRHPHATLAPESSWRQSLTDTDSLPSPDIIAAEIADDLEAALEQFTNIAARFTPAVTSPG